MSLTEFSLYPEPYLGTWDPSILSYTGKGKWKVVRGETAGHTEQMAKLSTKHVFTL